MAGVVLWERMRAKPNVCVIVVDSLRANALSQAAGAAKTPNIRQLIRDGVQFRRTFSHSPATLPSHASLFTGRHPHEIGVVQDGQSFAGNVELFAEELADNGYETYGTVSLPALHAPSTGFAIERGFDEWHESPNRYGRAAELSPVLGAQVAELAGSEPFFLYAHFADPHEPYDANDSVVHKANVLFRGELLETVTTSETSFIEHKLRVPPGSCMFDIRSEHAFRMRELTLEAPNEVSVTPRKSDYDNDDGDVAILIDNRTDEMQDVLISAWLHDLPNTSEARVRYRHEVEAVDAAIGQIIADLKARGVYDNTLIVLTSDHGEALGEHGVLGHGTTLYDEVLQVPLVMKLPKDCELEPVLARNTESLARQIDIAPTILELLGLNSMRSATGTSLVRVEPRVLIAETHFGTPTRSLYCMRDERYKLIYIANDNRFEMYDLAQDPSELDDVFRTQGHLRSEWQTELKTLLHRSPE